MSEKYNGWTNYPTWRVNIEVCDDLIQGLADGESTYDDVYALSKAIESDTEDVITNYGELEGLAVDYAMAFLANVNWYEIAEHAAEDHPTLIASDDEAS